MAVGSLVDVVMPQMGVSVSEGTISRWAKQVGDKIEADETIVEISTDKVDTEVPSPASGTVVEILVQEGETVPVTTVIARIDTAGGAPLAPVEPVAPSPEPAAAPEPAAPAAPPEAAAPRPLRPRPPSRRRTSAPPPRRAATTRPAPFMPTCRPHRRRPRRPPRATPTATCARSCRPSSRGWWPSTSSTSTRFPAPAAVAASPRTTSRPSSPAARPLPLRRPPLPPPLAAARCTGSGRSRSCRSGTGRRRTAAPPLPAPVAPRPAPAPAAAPAAGSLNAGEEIYKFSTIRKAISKHMMESILTTAQLTTVIEVDMSAVVAHRAAMKADFKARNGLNLTYLPFIMKATVDAIGKWPWVNAEIRDNEAIIKRSVNLGMAVAVDDSKGLLVPVIKNAESLSMVGLARALTDLADRARAKTLTIDEMTGASFTITNPGGYGALIGTPILPVGTTAIIDIEAIMKRPVVITDEQGNDAIGIRSMMYLPMTYDHRLVDGAYAAQFLRDLKRNLETWPIDAYIA